jgi:hypothetical protein
MPKNVSDERVELGHAIFNLAEPHPGYELAWNRYYERDHLIAGATFAPWTMATQRWLATRAHKAVRYPRENPIAKPVEKGTFVAGIWIQKGRYEDQQLWVADQMKIVSSQEGRNFEERDVLTICGYDRIGTVLRDEDGVPPELALDRRYPGLVLAWVERTSEHSLEELRDVLVEKALPEFLAKSPIAQALCFTPLPKARWWPKAAPEVAGVGDRIVIAFFVECDPLEVWEERFARLGAIVEADGIGRTLFVAPFVPVVPGVDPDLTEL